jgi:hypothetical protein
MLDKYNLKAGLQKILKETFFAPQAEMINPINPTVAEQIINHTIIDHVLYDPTTLVFDDVLRRLRNIGISKVPRRDTPITESYLSRIHDKMIKGQRSIVLPAYFRGKLGSRYGKDMVYSKLWALVDLFIPGERTYCGLPANQLGQITERIDGSITAYETDKKMLRWLREFRCQYLPEDRDIQILNEDILLHLKHNNNKANILDLDLMCNIKSEDQVFEWGKTIGNAVQLPAIVHLTTSIGHSITEERYRKIMPDKLIEGVKEATVPTVKYIEDKYRDRVIPMRTVMLILTDEKEQRNDTSTEGSTHPQGT